MAYERGIERDETELSDSTPYISSGHGDTAECHAEPPTCGCPETRTFVVKVTEEKVTQYRLTLAEAMTLFPEVRWDEEDVSHAGDMEDETYANAALPPGFKELDADDTDESIDYRIWEE